MKYKGAFKPLGLHNDHTTNGRPTYDYYSTPPLAVQWLLQYETFNKNIWETCCGGGAISETLKDYGYNVTSSDIHHYGYDDTIIQDFLTVTNKFNGDIVTNPPFNDPIPFVLKAYELCDNKVAMLFKIQFLETIQRYKRIFSRIPPSRIYIFVKRIRCLKNGIMSEEGSAICYCWIVWDKSCDNEPIVRWIPNYRELDDKLK